jgi:hypothetical protein
MTCYTHTRAFLPPSGQRRGKFICVFCDEECDPTKDNWTALEYIGLDEMQEPYKWSKFLTRKSRPQDAATV